MAPLYTACALLTAALAAYGLGYYLCGLLFYATRGRTQVAGDAPQEPVAVLVPARDEGQRALRVLASLLAQDHRGPLQVHLLIEDAQDTSVPWLRQRFPEARLDVAAPARVTLLDEPLRQVCVHYTGLQPKSDKINAAVAGLDTPWTGILDCDHQAHPEWIRTSLGLLAAGDARMIQCRREPLAAHGFYRFWDSLPQHVGCEVFNGAFTATRLPVYFTGTTAILATDLLKARPLRARITEDIDFSYAQLMSGVRMIHNPLRGSDEETSPDLYSFLARRRRWSRGHTQAFIEHLGQLPGAPLSLREKAQFLFHGSHYLVSALVFLLHLLIGLVFMPELSQTSLVAAGLVSGLLSGILVATQRTRGVWARAAEWTVLFAWLFPGAVLGMNLAQAVLIGQLPRAALPIDGGLQVLGLVGLAAPLTLLLIGLAGLRQLSPGTLLVTVLSYPFAFYLDISGVLLGLVDLVIGRATWRAVTRADAQQPSGADPSELVPAVGLRGSWQGRAALARAAATAIEELAAMKRPARAIPLLVIFGLFTAGVVYSPSTRIPVAERACHPMQDDGLPWIVPAAKLAGWCDADPETQGPRYGRRSGTFRVERQDDLQSVDPTYWAKLDTTFFCNEAVFTPSNVRPGTGGGVALHVENAPGAEKAYTAGSIATHDGPDAAHLYGRYETVLKVPKGSGLVTALFLYRFDPWQEIDLEFVGRDTTQVLLNVFYNPGDDGDLHNYGLRGTPVMVELGFDATDDFHEYAIEWEPAEIRWFVDGELIHVRNAGRPAPIPHLPMRLHLNSWPICSEELAGPLGPITTETKAEIRSVSVSSWRPSPLDRLGARLGLRDPSDWRNGADWVQ